MRRSTLPRRLPGHQEPLADRVDAAGIRQREDPTEARRLRAVGFAAGDDTTEDAAGWWKHDGNGGWDYHGNDPMPTRGPV